jgi:hypothetical protein
VSPREPPAGAESGDTQLDLSHLRREVRTALELAIVGPAPEELIDRLASIAGLLEAVAELPADSPPVLALIRRLVVRTRESLAEWDAWQKEHVPRAKA